MPYARYTPEEVAPRGEGLYEQHIRAQVEAENQGKFLVVDIETGAYEIDEDDLTLPGVLGHPVAFVIHTPAWGEQYA